MALLLRDREATPEAAAPPPGGAASIVSPAFACETCGTAMARGQDWCLECGTAAPGRLGARPGWRAAFTVVGLTLLLVCCAVVASYAALTSDAERDAAAPSGGTGEPIIAQTPGVTPPATGTLVQPAAPTGPGTTAPPVVPPGPVVPVTPPPAAKNTPIAPITPAPAPATSGTTKPSPSTNASPGSPGSSGTSTDEPAAPALISLKADAASTYDPAKRRGAEFGPAKNAVDGKSGTVWDVVVPADNRPLGVGLVVNLGAPHKLSSLTIDTPTSGFRLEIYGAVDAKQLPADVLDKRWIHLTDRKAVQDGATIPLAGKGKDAKVQLVLLHFTQPAEPTDPRVAIGGIELHGTP